MLVTLTLLLHDVTRLCALNDGVTVPDGFFTTIPLKVTDDVCGSWLQALMW